MEEVKGSPLNICTGLHGDKPKDNKSRISFYVLTSTNYFLIEVSFFKKKKKGTISSDKYCHYYLKKTDRSTALAHGSFQRIFKV